jgi:hypothetical protein
MDPYDFLHCYFRIFVMGAISTRVVIGIVYAIFKGGHSVYEAQSCSPRRGFKFNEVGKLDVHVPVKPWLLTMPSRMEDTLPSKL